MNFSKIKEYYKSNRLVVDCTLLAILFFVNCFVPNFCYFSFSIVALFTILEDRKNGFSILVFSMPFCGIEDYNSVYLLFACFAIYLIKNYIMAFFIDKKPISYPVLISILAFVGYSLLPIGEYNISLFIKLGSAIFLILMFNLFIKYGDIFNLKFNLNILAIGLIISCAFFLTYFISPMMHEKKLWSVGDSFIRFTAFFAMNPNVLAMTCSISLSLLTFYLLQNKFEWTDIIAYVTFAVVGLSTFSKNFLLMFGIMAIILVVYLIKTFKWKAVWVLAGLAFLGVIILIFKGDIFKTYLYRFTNWDSDLNSYEKLLDVATTGRYKLWTTVLSYLFENPDVIFFGRGFGAPMVASMSAHNFYISMIYELGLIGSTLFILIFVFMLRELKKNNPNKISKAIWVPIVIIGLIMCAEDLFLYIY